jgi:excisionase family DNA binding protein
MTVAEAAGQLGVSRRQVQRLAAAGTLAAQRGPGGVLAIDPVSVPAVRPGRGRPWSAPMAWGALWRLSGLEPGWLTAVQRRRLDGMLTGIEPERLLASVRNRGAARRFVAGAHAVEALRPFVAVTDGPADLQGYVTPERLAELVAHHPITRDPAGNVTLFVTDLTAVAELGEVPDAVRAVDRGDLVAVDDLLHDGDGGRAWMTGGEVAGAIGEELARGDDDFAFRMLARGVADLRSRRRPADVARFLAPPPTTGDERWDALLAAVVGRECRRRGIAAPAWTDVAPLRPWWFPLLASPMLAARTMQRTPVEWSVRGIWLDANALETA